MGGRTVAFLFTDIEGSTRLWDDSPDAMSSALARHDALVRAAVAAHGGRVFRAVGDSFGAVFEGASEAVAAALEAQRALFREPWPTPLPVRVRMAVHRGEAEARDGGFSGAAVDRAARLLAVGHGGQTLVSGAASAAARGASPPGATLVPLGDHRLRDLAQPEAVYDLRHPDLPEGFPALRSLDCADLPNNLPEGTTRFVGRETELRDVAEALGRTRLLTLTGSGGTGKTRLALQAAAEAIDRHPGGAWLVELAALEDPRLVAATVAEALGVAEEAGRPLAASLAERLGRAPTLLVLDNCEHLLDAVARLAESLLRAVPTLRVLATSREPLGVGGEAVLRVPALSFLRGEARPTPEGLAGYDAVRLFVDRATAQRGDFALTDANAPALASLCLRLDGIPLAIELAAARVRSLSVEQIEARLDDRFRLLTGGSRTARPRQQTLRALVDWSHGLLNDAERAVLRRCAAFAGGWSLEAAEVVAMGTGVEAWEVLDVLASLVDKSLVIAEEEDGEVRYGLLETVRHYAQERLREAGEEAEAHTRHAAFFAALAVARGERCREGGEAGRRLARDADNLRAALDRGTMAQRLDMAGALRRYWILRGAVREGWERSRAALRADDPPSAGARRVRALVAAGALGSMLEEGAASLAFLEEGVALARRLDEPALRIDALNKLGAVLRNEGEPDRARETFEEARGVRPTVSTLANLAMVLVMMGRFSEAEATLDEAEATLRGGGSAYYGYYVHLNRERSRYEQGLLDEAEREAEAVRQAAEGLGSASLLLGARAVLGNVRRAQGRLVEAEAIACDVVERAASTDTREFALLLRGRVATALGKPEEAAPALRDFLRIARPCLLLKGLEAVAALLVATARPREAALLAGATEAARRARPMPMAPVDLPEHRRLLLDLRAALDPAFEDALAEGEAAGLDAARALALAALA